MIREFPPFCYLLQTLFQLSRAQLAVMPVVGGRFARGIPFVNLLFRQDSVFAVAVIHQYLPLLVLYT